MLLDTAKNPMDMIGCTTGPHEYLQTPIKTLTESKLANQINRMGYRQTNNIASKLQFETIRLFGKI